MKDHYWINNSLLVINELDNNIFLLFFFHTLKYILNIMLFIQFIYCL